MGDIIYLTAEEIQTIHFIIMQIHDDYNQSGLIEEPEKQNLFESMIVQPQTAYFGGEDNYSFPTEKAVCYYHSIVTGHMFHNGNKRTGFAVMATFLDLHGFKVTMLPDEVVEYTVKIATSDVYKQNGSVELIAEEMEANDWITKTEAFEQMSDEDQMKYFNPFKKPQDQGINIKLD